MRTYAQRSSVALVAILLCGLFASPLAWGQLVRQKAFGTATGSEEMGAMVAPAAGGYLLAGTQYFPQSGPLLSGKLYLLRLNAVGDTIWTRHYAVPGFYVLNVNYALEDAAGRVLLVGNGATYSAATQSDAFLVLLSPQGDTLWTRRTQSPFPDSYPSPPQLTPAGDFVLAANLNGVPQFLRITPSGQVAQQVIVQYSTADLGQVGLLLPAAGSGYWVLSYNSMPPYVGKFVRFNAAGNQGLSMPIPAATPIFADFLFDGSGYTVATGSGVARLDANLNTLWNRTVTARGYGLSPHFIRRTPDNNFLVGGSIVTGSGGQDLGFAKISPNAQPLKDTVLIRPGNETLCGLAVAPGTGNYIFSGWTTNGIIGGFDLFWGELLRSTATISATRGALAGGAGLTAYPNPLGAEEVVQLAAPQPLRGTLRLSDALGRPLRTWVGGGGRTQALALPPGLPAGLYLLTLTDAQGLRQTLRLVQP